MTALLDDQDKGLQAAVNPQNPTMRDKAKRWIDAGFPVGELIVLKPGTKIPLRDAWNSRSETEGSLLKAMDEGYNLGIKVRLYPAIDIEDSIYADVIFDVVRRYVPDAPVRSRVGSKSRAILSKFTELFDRNVAWGAGAVVLDDGSPSGKKIFEVFAHSQLHIEGSRADAGGVFLAWDKPVVEKELPELGWEEYADILRDVERELLLAGAAVKARIPGMKGPSVPGQGQGENRGESEISPNEISLEITDEILCEAIDCIENGIWAAHWDDWKVGCQAWAKLSRGSAEVEDKFRGWSDPATSNDNTATWFAKARSGKIQMGYGEALGTVQRWLRDHRRSDKVVEADGIITRLANAEAKAEPGFQSPLDEKDQERLDKVATSWKVACHLLRKAQQEPGQNLVGADDKVQGFLEVGDDILDQKVLVRPEITHWMARGQVSILGGAPGAGKSTLTILYALAIAYERPDLIGLTRLDWCGDVVLVPNEDRVRMTLRKLKAYRQKHGLKKDDRKHRIHILRERLTLVEKTKDGVMPTGDAIRIVQELAKIRATAKHGVAMLTLDTFASASGGGDENSVAETQPLMNAANDIAEAGFCSVAILHHTGKSADGGKVTMKDIRGSSAIIGAARTVLAVNSVEGEHEKFGWTEDEARNTVRTKVVKTGEHGPSDEHYFRFESVTLQADDPRDLTLPATVTTGIVVALPKPVGVVKDFRADVRAVLDPLLASGEELTIEPSAAGSMGGNSAVRVVLDALGLDRKKERKGVHEGLGGLIADGVYKVEERLDRYRNPRRFLARA